MIYIKNYFNHKTNNKKQSEVNVLYSNFTESFKIDQKPIKYNSTTFFPNKQEKAMIRNTTIARPSMLSTSNTSNFTLYLFSFVFLDISWQNNEVKGYNEGYKYIWGKIEKKSSYFCIADTFLMLKSHKLLWKICFL